MSRIPRNKTAMVFKGNASHSAQDFIVKEIPEIVANQLRRATLPHEFKMLLQELPDEFDDNLYLTIPESMKIIYNVTPQDDSAMQAKKSENLYIYFHEILVGMELHKRAKLDFSFALNNATYIIAMCKDAFYFECPDVLHRMNAFESLEQCVGARKRCWDLLRGTVQNTPEKKWAAFMQPVLAATLMAPQALRYEIAATDGMNPGNVHIVHLLWVIGLSGLLDFSGSAVRGASNGIGKGLFLADGGGAYLTPAVVERGETSSFKMYLNKTNSTGADFAVNRFKILVNPTTYDNSLTAIQLETLTDFTPHAIRVACSDVYLEGVLFRKATQRNLNYNFFVTELQFSKDSSIENTLVDIVERETWDNSIKSRSSTAKSAADSRGALKYTFVNRPRIGLLSSNNVQQQAYERIRTLTDVIRVTQSAVWCQRGDMTGVMTTDRVSAASQLESSRWMFLDSYYVTSVVAMMQREGLLGKHVEVLPTVSGIWQLFYGELIRCSGYFNQRFQVIFWHAVV